MAIVDAGGLDVPDAPQWLWLASLLAVPGTGHMLMNWAHAHVRLVIASMLNLSVPALSTAGAFLFLNEDVSAVQVLGVVIVISGLAFVVRREAELRPG